MVDEWRLIELSANDGYMNMAIDEALIQQISGGHAPNTIRFYRWQPSAVSIGFFQSINEEVDVKTCEKMGVDIVRRITGGGAVYHDYYSEVTYSMITHTDDSHIPSDILQSYAVICRGLVLGLSELGLDAEFKPVNDILVNGRKISGNAQTRRIYAVLQHGTVLVDVDVPKMFRLLKVSDQKIRDKMISNVEERVTSIRRELKTETSLESVVNALARGFEEALQIRLVKAELGSDEWALANELRNGKYASKQWIYQR